MEYCTVEFKPEFTELPSQPIVFRLSEKDLEILFPELPFYQVLWGSTSLGIKPIRKTLPYLM